MNKEEFLLNLTQEVLLPVMKILEKKVNVKNIPKLIRKMYLNAFTLLPFLGEINDEIIENFQNKNVIEDINKLGLDKEDLILILSYLYCRVKIFIDKYNYHKFAKEYNKLFYEICDILENDDIEESKKDNFLEVYSTQDESIQNMHYRDEDKISAKEFMDQEELDEDLIIDIKDLLENYEDIKYKYDLISKEYIKNIKEILSKFNTIFFLIGEFKDLAKIIENFIGLLNELDIESLSDSQKIFLKMFIDAFIDDLKKWYEEVIVYESANDIHYLDASLMSSIQQIEKYLKNSEA